MTCSSSQAECTCDRKARIKCACLPCLVLNLYFFYILSEVTFLADELFVLVIEGRWRACATLKSLKKYFCRIQVMNLFRWWELQQQLEMSWSCFACFYHTTARVPLCCAPLIKAERQVNNVLPVQSHSCSFTCLWQCKKDCRGNQSLS